MKCSPLANKKISEFGSQEPFQSYLKNISADNPNKKISLLLTRFLIDIKFLNHPDNLSEQIK
ncbi:hypothetical protein DB895_03085 [Flavobacterium psychrotolerans]|uniref:Uncharacterized protein n=1 Tax=Flavobacterium psychrotolerans TaxID=2169410 RepID=A0A2U1JMN0_9FLAO|nr:hypothetical protein DB895_03085 [Flavobacterium psychrotolerans]